MHAGIFLKCFHTFLCLSIMLRLCQPIEALALSSQEKQPEQARTTVTEVVVEIPDQGALSLPIDEPIQQNDQDQSIQIVSLPQDK
jgi:hypothetical protein